MYCLIKMSHKFKLPQVVKKKHFVRNITLHIYFFNGSFVKSNSVVIDWIVACVCEVTTTVCLKKKKRINAI